MFAIALARNIIAIRIKKNTFTFLPRVFDESIKYKKKIYFDLCNISADRPLSNNPKYVECKNRCKNSICFCILHIFDCLIMACRPKYYMDQKQIFYILYFRQILEEERPMPFLYSYSNTDWCKNVASVRSGTNLHVHTCHVHIREWYQALFLERLGWSRWNLVCKTHKRRS